MRQKIAGKTSLQVSAIKPTYVGKWTKVEGKVYDVSHIWAEKWSVTLLDDEGVMVHARFGKAAFDSLMALNKDDWITVEGPIDDIERSVSLDPATILHVGKHPKAASTPRPRKPRAPKAT